MLVTIPRGRYDDVAVEMALPQLLEAPIEAGAELGQLRITLDDEELHVAPLVALASVAEAGAFSRFWDFLTLLFNGQSE